MHNSSLPIARLSVLAFLLAVSGCDLIGIEEAAPREPFHVTVVCDASTSSLAAACTTESLEAVARAWVGDAVRRPGSTLSIIQVGPSRDTAAEIASLAVPLEWGPGLAARRTRFVEESLAAVAALTPVSAGSAIVEAIDLGADRLSERTGERVLVVMSDLRQDAPGGVHFERRVLPPRRFVRWLEERRLVPDFGSVRLGVCGVHGGRGPRAREHTAADDDALRATWAAAFTAMGREGLELHRTCDAATLVQLGGAGPTRAPVVDPVSVAVNERTH